MSDNPRRLSFPFQLGDPGILIADKQFSLCVSRALDCLGYNQDMVKYRVKMYKKEQELNNKIMNSTMFEHILTGSKSEGLTSIFESDTDTMHVVTEVMCADNVIPFIHSRNIAVLFRQIFFHCNNIFLVCFFGSFVLM